MARYRLQSLDVDPVPWRVAWHEALYAAERGFYVTRGGPAAHFTTATHGVTGVVLADALLRLWRRSHDDLPAVIVDVGAGRGELVTHLLHALEPTEPVAGAAERRAPTIVGVDVVARPAGLDDRIGWIRSPGGPDLPARLAALGLDDALVIAHEWLDVVPCDIAEVDGDGTLRTVLVDPVTGDESLGGPPPGDELAWAAHHWPGGTTGDRVEIGRTRDEAWSRLVALVGSGVLVAVDYGHLRSERPRGGTLAAYEKGRLTRPIPDGTCDITAHVAMDTLDADEVHRQRDLLRELGIRGETPDHGLSAEPMAYLRGLERTSAEAELIRSGGFGDFWWAVKRVGNAP